MPTVTSTMARYLPLTLPPAWTRTAPLPPVLVVGPPRTGTSAVAGILDRLGVFMGYRFHPPDDGNPRGYGEDLDFVHLHCLMLERQRDMPLLLGGLQYLIAARQSLGVPWGVKDPRLIGVAPAWLALCQEARWVRTTRPEADALASYQRRNPDKSAAESAALWQKIHAAGITYFPRLGPHTLTVAFDDLMRDPCGVTRRLAALCGLTPDDALVAHAAAHVQPREQTLVL
jgi:hypothetical protein